MEKRSIDGVTVNDGKGLLDNDGLMQTIIVDCNDAVKGALSGNYISFCDKMVQVVQKVSLLRKNWEQEMNAKEKQIADLMVRNHELLEGITGIPDEYGVAGKDGEQHE